MYSPSKRNSIENEPRYAKLRASCDPCFLAKVKCSKSRPICSRCLACGADCKYSPSSRAGKPKSDSSNKGHRVSLSADMVIPEGPAANRYIPTRMNTENTFGMATEDVGWNGMLGSPDGSMGDRRSISSASLAGIADERTGMDHAANPMFDHTFGWPCVTPQPDLNAAYIDPTTNLQYRSKTIHDGLPQPSVAWYSDEQANASANQYTQSTPISTAMPNIFVPPTSPTTSQSFSTQNSACNCFNTCLQALGALHNSNIIASPSFSPLDVILTVNQKAVETCTVMLNCPICMSTSRTGFSSRTMFLGTILGVIISIYQDTSTNYFGAGATTPSFNGILSNDLELVNSSASPSPQMETQNSYPTPPHHSYAQSPSMSTHASLMQVPPPLTFGSYRVAKSDVRWLQMEIILRDLRKLKELFAKFQEMAVKGGRQGNGRSKEDDVGMHSAVAEFLCRSLEETTECLRGQREMGCGAF